MRDKILKNISKNGKITPKDLAAMLDMSEEEVTKEIADME